MTWAQRLHSVPGGRLGDNVCPDIKAILKILSMRRFFTFWFLALLLSLQAESACAVELEGLYEAEVPVAGQQLGERERALQAALAQVLVKVSGQRSVVHNAGVTEALKTPSQYVQQYRYRDLPPDANSPMDTGRPSQVLWSQFDRVAVNRLLKEQGLPIWGKARPAIVAWLAVETGGRRAMAGSEDTDDISTALQTRAVQRGLPLVIPLFDLEDQARVRISDVWGEFTDRLVAASARYRSDVVLLGRAQKVLPSLWEVRWNLVTGQRSERWSTQADVLLIALDEGIDRTADLLAKQFAYVQQADASGFLDMVVADVRSLEDYAKVLNYLQSLDMVEGVQTTRVQPGEAWFRLKSPSEREVVGKAISLGRTLSLMPSQAGWKFRLVP